MGARRPPAPASPLGRLPASWVGDLPAASGTIRWQDIEALFIALGAEISEREGSRIGVFLFGQIRVFHRPHPTPETDKGAVASIRKWLEENGISP